jgi:hypothetical protein
MQIVLAATLVGWHVRLKIFKKSIHPNHYCALKHAFLPRAIIVSTFAISAASVPTIARKMPFSFKMGFLGSIRMHARVV